MFLTESYPATARKEKGRCAVGPRGKERRGGGPAVISRKVEGEGVRAVGLAACCGWALGRFWATRREEEGMRALGCGLVSMEIFSSFFFPFLFFSIFFQKSFEQRINSNQNNQYRNTMLQHDCITMFLNL